jgi:predicted nucleic acid-binding protein
MEWLRALHGTIVGLDTAPLIYFIEQHPTYLPLLLPFFEAVERGDIQVVTSTLTLTEVLVHPYRDGNPELAERYFHMLLHARNLRTVALSPAIAAEAARVRADFQMKTPDAIQLATAKEGGATSFVTNDGDLASIPGLRMIVLRQVLRGSSQATT